MDKAQAAKIWVKSGLLSRIEGLYMEQRMQRQTDTPEGTLAQTGFKNPQPFLDALEIERRGQPLEWNDFPVNPMAADMSFNTFVQSNSYKTALELVFRIARDSPFQSRYPVICGGEGQGKTHLLHATEQDLKRFHPERQAVLVNMLELAMALVRAGRRGTRSDLVSFLTRVGVLLIDDIQLCEADRMLQQNLLEIMEKQPAQPGSKLVMTCDVRPENLQISEAGLKKALANTTLGEIKPMDIIERSSMTARLSGGIDLPIDVRNHIAENMTGSVRELKGAVMSMLAAAREHGRPLDLSLARDILSLYAPGHDRYAPLNNDGAHAGENRGTTPAHHPQLLKDMLSSARNNDEHLLANQLAISKMIHALGRQNPALARPMRARLRLALQAIREKDLATASEMMQPQDNAPAQSMDAAVEAAESRVDIS